MCLLPTLLPSCGYQPPTPGRSRLVLFYLLVGDLFVQDSRFLLTVQTQLNLLNGIHPMLVE